MLLKLLVWQITQEIPKNALYAKKNKKQNKTASSQVFKTIFN